MENANVVLLMCGCRSWSSTSTLCPSYKCEGQCHFTGVRRASSTNPRPSSNEVRHLFSAINPHPTSLHALRLLSCRFHLHTFMSVVVVVPLPLEVYAIRGCVVMCSRAGVFDCIFLGCCQTSSSSVCLLVSHNRLLVGCGKKESLFNWYAIHVGLDNAATSRILVNPAVILIL